MFDRKTGRIFGAQAVGYDGVDKRIDVIATAIKGGMTVFDLPDLELAYAPPYSSAKDPVNMAGYVASNIIENMVETIQWHEVNQLVKTGHVSLTFVKKWNATWDLFRAQSTFRSDNYANDFTSYQKMKRSTFIAKWDYAVI